MLYTPGRFVGGGLWYGPAAFFCRIATSASSRRPSCVFCSKLFSVSVASLALVARSPPTPPGDKDLAFVHFIWEVPQKFEIRVLMCLVI